jgi:hypothetical protein
MKRNIDEVRNRSPEPPHKRQATGSSVNELPPFQLVPDEVWGIILSFCWVDDVRTVLLTRSRNTVTKRVAKEKEGDGS